MNKLARIAIARTILAPENGEAGVISAREATGAVGIVAHEPAEQA